MISRKTITRWLLITASTDWGSRPYRPGYTRTHTHKRQPLPQRTYNLNKQNKGNDESKKQRGGITCVRTQDSFGLASCLKFESWNSYPVTVFPSPRTDFFKLFITMQDTFFNIYNRHKKSQTKINVLDHNFPISLLCTAKLQSRDSEILSAMRCNNSEWNTESFETNENIQEYQFLPEQSGLSNPHPPSISNCITFLCGEWRNDNRIVLHDRAWP